ncbi:MAG TPA: hypothetical protein VH761_05530 [Ilumatobacteraceae bacterium]|jgi:hypothetical protein
MPARLTADELGDLVERLTRSSPLHADMLVADPVDAEPLPTPDVLGDVAAYRVTVHARRRPVELIVADIGDGSGDVMVLGDGARVDALAQRIGLRLQEQTDVAEFVRFWCRAAVRRMEQLVETPADFQWIPGVTTDPDLRAHAERAARLARRVVVGHPAAGAFPVEVTMLDQRTLHLRHLRVTNAGHVDEIDRVELTRDVPVPYSIP